MARSPDVRGKILTSGADETAAGELREVPDLTALMWTLGIKHRDTETQRRHRGQKTRNLRGLWPMGLVKFLFVFGFSFSLCLLCVSVPLWLISGGNDTGAGRKEMT